MILILLTIGTIARREAPCHLPQLNTLRAPSYFAAAPIFVPLGSFFKTPSTVFGSFAKRNCDAAAPL
jgi:hypothetical protein